MPQKLTIRNPKIIKRLNKTGRFFPSFWRLGWIVGLKGDSFKSTCIHEEKGIETKEVWLPLFWNIWWLDETTTKKIDEAP